MQRAERIDWVVAPVRLEAEAPVPAIYLAHSRPHGSRNIGWLLHVVVRFDVRKVERFGVREACVGQAACPGERDGGGSRVTTGCYLVEMRGIEPLTS